MPETERPYAGLNTEELLELQDNTIFFRGRALQGIDPTLRETRLNELYQEIKARLAERDEMLKAQAGSTSAPSTADAPPADTSAGTRLLLGGAEDIDDEPVVTALVTRAKENLDPRAIEAAKTEVLRRLKERLDAIVHLTNIASTLAGLLHELPSALRRVFEDGEALRSTAAWAQANESAPPAPYQPAYPCGHTREEGPEAFAHHVSRETTGLPFTADQTASAAPPARGGGTEDGATQIAAVSAGMKQVLNRDE